MSFPAKYKGTCGVCGNAFAASTLVSWSKDKRIAHEECASNGTNRTKASGASTSVPRPVARSTATRSTANPLAAASSRAALSRGNGPRIAVVAFNKHIASAMEAILLNNVEHKGTREQEAIWDAMLNAGTHIVVKAAAGSGKSFSIQQGVLRLMRTQDASAMACTYHSLGLAILRKTFGKVKVNEYKLRDILDGLDRMGLDDAAWYALSLLTEKLVRLCKSYLIDGNDSNRLEELADYHSIDAEPATLRKAIALVPGVLQACAKNTYEVDFDDMPWLPVVLGLRGDVYDFLITDESQDLSKVQQMLMRLACPNGRIMVVGDPFQAIYAWRGADAQSMANLQDELVSSDKGCGIFPLTVTRRCPKLHVKLATNIVGDGVIRAMEDAPEGIVRTATMKDALLEMQPGDMALCRVNKHLVPVAYDLIRRGVKAVVRGRDIGSGLEALIKKLGSPDNVDDLLDKLADFRAKEVHRLSKQKYSEGRVAALEDKCETLSELCEGLKYTYEVIAKINQIFADFDSDGAPKHAVVLSTVHRGKGIEANKIWILAPDLIPHPMAQQAWEMQGEENLAYVACTRSRWDIEHSGELIFIGGVPEIYGYAGTALEDDGLGTGEDLDLGEDECGEYEDECGEYFEGETDLIDREDRERHEHH